MKNLTKITAIAVLLSVGFIATSAAQIGFGVRAGANYSNIASAAEGQKPKAAIGFDIGVFAELSLSDKLTLSPELNFSRVGAKDLPFSYITVPVLVKYNITESFNVHAGLQAGLLVSAKAKIEKESVDVKDFYKSLDFGIPVGVEYMFTENIGVGLRYVFGLANVAKTIEAETAGATIEVDSKLSTRNLQLSVRYRF